MITDEELKQIGMTREEWNDNLANEAWYIEKWADTVQIDKPENK